MTAPDCGASADAAITSQEGGLPDRIWIILTDMVAGAGVEPASEGYGPSELTVTLPLLIGSLSLYPAAFTGLPSFKGTQHDNGQPEA